MSESSASAPIFKQSPPTAFGFLPMVSALPVEIPSSVNTKLVFISEGLQSVAQSLIGVQQGQPVANDEYQQFSHGRLPAGLSSTARRALPAWARSGFDQVYSEMVLYSAANPLREVAAITLDDWPVWIATKDIDAALTALCGDTSTQEAIVSTLPDDTYGLLFLRRAAGTQLKNTLYAVGPCEMVPEKLLMSTPADSVISQIPWEPATKVAA